MFPDFNKYSSPLIFFLILGLVVGFCILIKYKHTKRLDHLYLSVLLGVMSFDLIHYSLGFMGWYNEYRTTKINYILIDVGLLFGPLIYLFVRHALQPNLKTKDWHRLLFVPFGIHFMLSILLFVIDATIKDFNLTQNGWLKQSISIPYLEPIVSVLFVVSTPLYLAFAYQSYLIHLKNLPNITANDSFYRLKWLKNFVILYASVYTIRASFMVVDTFITDLDYINYWWLNLISCASLAYLAIMTWFDNSYNLAFNEVESEQNYQKKYGYNNVLLQELLDHMSTKRPYLNSGLNLPELARQLGWSRTQLSEVINKQTLGNFSDFINEYRVQAVILALSQGQNKNITLMAIANDCGFNSKATFNRVFKKVTGIPPSMY